MSGPGPGEAARLRLLIRGRVQGVGFRPTMYRLCRKLDLRGTIANSDQGVAAELQGPRAVLEELLRLLPGAMPRHARIQSLEESWLETGQPAEGLRILASVDQGQGGARIPADLATCEQCLAELWDPADRRHLYPFINCTSCGPRFTIVTSLPYDRPRTTMARFALCPRCLKEYEDPTDRRYHAEPTACPACGPRLRLVDRSGAELAGEPVHQAAARLRAGQVLAVKGLGGFHLAVDARNPGAVASLRLRKGRQDKPFAVMVQDLDEAALHVQVSRQAAGLLTSVAAPIVLLRRRAQSDLAPEVAPGNPHLGLMLPYTPLHHLLLARIPALVMTSGNLSEEPIAIDNEEARGRLGELADVFLEHDRQILVACEDSVLGLVETGPAGICAVSAGPGEDGVLAGPGAGTGTPPMAVQTMFLRRSRGYVPDPIDLGLDCGKVLATGGQLKNTFCLTLGQEAFLGPHVGDLDSPESYDAFVRAVMQMTDLLHVEPEAVVHDLHPDYGTTRYAAGLGLPLLAVQHHHAHAASVLADHQARGPALGLSLDGTGYGTDGTIWGGELLILPDAGRCERAGCLRPFPLPGGDACIRRPARTALALVWTLLGPGQVERAVSLLDLGPEEVQALEAMLRSGLGCVTTSSLGRLYDAVAALCGVGARPTFEGQTAMALEHLAERGDSEPAYPVELDPAGPRGLLLLDPAPALQAVCDDLLAGLQPAAVAGRFQAGLARALVQACARLCRRAGIGRVTLGGGCFQNRYLLREVSRGLAACGLEALFPGRVPVNDGGLSLGQVLVHAVWQQRPR